MTNKEKCLQLLGLAQRAGKVISGEDLTIKAIQQHKAYLVLVASDASANLQKKIIDKTTYYKIERSTAFTSLELSLALGKSRKTVAVCDAGFAKKMRTLMD